MCDIHCGINNLGSIVSPSYLTVRKGLRPISSRDMYHSYFANPLLLFVEIFSLTNPVHFSENGNEEIENDCESEDTNESKMTDILPLVDPK